MITTNAVVLETCALLLTRTRDGRRSAIAYLDSLDQGAAEVVRATAEDEAEAARIVRSHEDKAYSLCDALSFAAMERLGIETAISFDRHFREYGCFTVLHAID